MNAPGVMARDEEDRWNWAHGGPQRAKTQVALNTVALHPHPYTTALKLAPRDSNMKEETGLDLRLEPEPRPATEETGQSGTPTPVRGNPMHVTHDSE